MRFITSKGGIAVADTPLPSSFDALLPAEMTERAIRIGTEKALLPAATLLLLATLAGAFMGFGSLFSLTVITGTEPVVPYGLAKLLSGFAFSLGPILIVVGGAELFTGNNLMVIAWASRKIRTTQVLRAWLLVYAGNAVGALLVAFVALIAQDYMHAGGALGRIAMIEASAKASLSFSQAFIHGVAGNALICLAVWLSYSARSTTDKILAVVPPITAFVATGFEHSVANMFLLPFAMLVRLTAPDQFWAAANLDPGIVAAISPAAIATNIGAVTLGNIVGGVAVGIAYWSIYHRRSSP